MFQLTIDQGIQIFAVEIISLFEIKTKEKGTRGGFIMT